MKDILNRVLNHEVLTCDETRDILVGITQEKYPQAQVTALITALKMRGITAEELLGFRQGILLTGVPVKLDCNRYIDIVGTGGDKKNTFNISTLACFVVAGAGYKVVKHGNYAATSTSGASNVMANHGIKFTDNIDLLNKSLDKCGVVYLHAQLFAKAMKYVAPIRQALPFPTFFNLLGPIVNPSQPHCQFLGTANLEQLRLYATVCRSVGTDFGIVNSIDGYDEISLTDDFMVTTNNYERLFKPQEIGFNTIKAIELDAGDTLTNATRIFDSVLDNTSTQAQKDVVVANSAFAIQVLERGKKGIDECKDIALRSIESGKALETFRIFVELNS